MRCLLLTTMITAMQVKHFLILFCCLSALARPIALYGQGAIRENEKGEKIIVYPDGSWRFFNQPKGGLNYPVNQSQITGLDQPVRLTEEDARRIASRRAQLAREATAIAMNRAEQAAQQRTRLEDELKRNPGKEHANRLNLRLNAARTTEKETQQEAQLAQQELAQAEGLAAKGDILQELKKSLEKRSTQTALPSTESIAQELAPNLANLGAAYYFNWNTGVAQPTKTYTPGCTFAFNGKDQSGRYRRDMEKQLLFTYTDERLRLFLKDKEYLRCEGFLSSAEGFRFLTLEFSFAYPNAREAYGFIEKGSTLTVKLLNGQFINLQSGTMDAGSYDTKQDITSYLVQYPIDQSVLSLLHASEIESIRVFWSSGYEEYPVFNLDFFQRQLKCLEGGK